MAVTKEMVRTALRIVLGAAYFLAGVMHLRAPSGFIAITPGWVPYPEAVIFLTGLCEIAGAVALVGIPRLRMAAGIGLAAYAVCVFPANINHAINGIVIGGTRLDWSYHGPRLAFQPVLVWLALWTGHAIEWPLRPREAA